MITYIEIGYDKGLMLSLEDGIELVKLLARAKHVQKHDRYGSLTKLEPREADSFKVELLPDEAFRETTAAPTIREEAA